MSVSFIIIGYVWWWRIWLRGFSINQRLRLRRWGEWFLRKWGMHKYGKKKSFMKSRYEFYFYSLWSLFRFQFYYEPPHSLKFRHCKVFMVWRKYASLHEESSLFWLSVNIVKYKPWQDDLNTSSNDGLAIDHGNEDESDSSGLHEEVEESDSSEDEVCCFLCFLKFFYDSIDCIGIVMHLSAFPLIFLYLTGCSSKYNWCCSLGVVSGWETYWLWYYREEDKKEGKRR